MNNSVMFTALPSGIASATPSGTVVSLSVFVTPQLAASASLSGSPFADWPSLAAGLTFSVALGTSPTAPTAPCWLDPGPQSSYAIDRFDSGLWNAIFGAPAGSSSSPVSVNAFLPPNYVTSGVLSFGSQAVSSAVKSTYGSLAALTTKPTITQGGTDALSKATVGVAGVMTVPAPGSKKLVSSGAALLTGVTGAIPTSPTAPAPSLSKTALQALQAQGKLPGGQYDEFARVAAYHNRKNYRGIAPVGSAGSTSSLQVDFHQILTQLADHPAVLRRLGLIIDLQFTVPATAAGMDGPTNIVLQPSAIPGLTPATPVTYCILHQYGSASAVAFRPYYGDIDPPGATATPLIDTNGLLWIGNSSILNLDDLDIDHAAIHLANYAEQAHSDLNATPAPGGGAASLEVTLPALRTTGFALHHTDREASIGLRFAKNANWGGSATFVAEDFLRGFRVDVRAVSGPTNAPTYGNWLSLCYRQATFAFTNGFPGFTISDQGYVKSSGVSAPPAAATGSAGPVYNVNEALFHWDGWSLVASRPGGSVGASSAVTADDGGTGPLPTDGPVFPKNCGKALGLPFSTTIVPGPGTLPKLRFGTQYQFRVRAVDLAGNDMQHSAAADNTNPHASPPMTFSRYEPVSPPNLQMRKAVTEGESVERLVIRSDPYASPPVYAAAWAANNSVATSGDGGAPTTVGMNPYFATCERHVSPPKASVQMAEWHGAFDQAIPSPTDPVTRMQQAWAIASKEDGGYYDAYVTDSTTTQYRTYFQPGRSIVTPPSVAPNVALALASGQPAFTGTQDIVPRGTALLGGQYVIFDTDSVMLPYLPDPNAQGVALQGLPTGSPAFRTYGPRASNPAGTAWPELSTWRLVLQESQGAAAVNGLDPQTTASAPVVVSLPPATVVTLTYSSTLNNPSLHKFCPSPANDPAYSAQDLANAQQGLLPLLSPSREITLVHAVQRPMAPGLVDGDIDPQDRNQGETAQTVIATWRFDGASSAKVDLLSSWNELIDQPTNVAADPTQPIPHSGVIASITPDATQTFVPGQIVRQLFGDTKARNITYATKATTRFREYFPSAITVDSTKITNATTLPNQIWCKSSARPPIPKVLYAVPSFIFSSSTSGSTTTTTTPTTSTRSGGVVRVYVDRGWYATGEGECLGVVLAPLAGENATAPGPNLVSQWGQDPIWARESGVLSALDANHINAATMVTIYPGVSLAEGAGTADIATFAPNFNSVRQLWYFDVGLNTDGAYFPFLRLALVRFQPQSIRDPNNPNGTLQASPVVLTEFVQLSATRAASVVNAGSGNYNVSLTGPTAPNLPSVGGTLASAASGHTVTAEFQEATTAAPDDIDWTTIPNTITVLAPLGGKLPAVTYNASMVFPTSSAIAGAHHRILFKEYEIYYADNQTGVRQGLGVVQLGSPTASYTQRVVYADAITISS